MKDSKTADKMTVNVIVYGGKRLKTVSEKHKYAVTCEIGQQKIRTDVVEDVFDNPVFNQQFQFQVDSVDQPLVFLVTEKRERDVLGQIVVPLSNVDDSCSAEPLRVPLQPGLRCPDLVSSPGELTYNVWMTTRDLAATPEDRSLTSRTTASLNKLRRRLHSSPTVPSATRWNDFKTNRRHSMDAMLYLHAGSSPDYCDIFFDGDSSLSTTGEDFMPIPSSDGYIKRSSLSTLSEYYFPRPHILEVCPLEGPSAGGTVVTVRGRDLGLSQDDVVGLSICGSDVVDSVQYISSERLVCTTVAWRPCVGSVTVETASGGRVCSAAQFTFSAGSEPPTSRLHPSFARDNSQPSTTKNRRQRFSLDALEKIESSYHWGDESQRTLGNDDIQKSNEVMASATTPCVAEIQATTPRNVTCPSRTLPPTDDHSHLTFYSVKESQESPLTNKQQTLMTELRAQLVSNQYHITELVEENKSLKEQYENLHVYIDGLLLRVFDACPQLLCVDLQ